MLETWDVEAIGEETKVGMESMDKGGAAGAILATCVVWEGVAAGTRRPFTTVRGLQDLLGREGAAADRAGLFKVIVRVFRAGYVKESDSFTFTFDFQVA